MIGSSEALVNVVAEIATTGGNSNMRHKKKALENPCRVYWGTHGCKKQRGHCGRHRCQSSCPRAEEYQNWYGEDVDNVPDQE